MIDPPTSSRPALHVTTDGWLNDPLAVTWDGERYHLFFQHVPGATTWALACEWGHAVSTDLLSWQRRPVALTPDDTEAGCWSGGAAVDDSGEPRLFYTSVDSQPDLGVIRPARAVDASWDTWVKGAPVVAAPPDCSMFRDPFVLRDGSGWRMLVGAGLADGSAAALGYSSSDLETWTYDGVVARRHPDEAGVWTGSGWECPQLIEVDGRSVLLVSVWDAGETQYLAAAVGEWVGGVFTPGRWQRLSHGDGPYAATAFRDRDDIPTVIAWLRTAADPAAGWAGALSIPMRLRLADDEIRLEPHPVLTTRRLPAGLDEPAARWEVRWTPVELDTLRGSGPDGEVVALTLAAGDLVVETDAGWQAVPGVTGAVTVVVDGPVLEVFTDLGICSAPLVAPHGLRWAADLDSDLTGWHLAAR